MPFARKPGPEAMSSPYNSLPSAKSIRLLRLHPGADDEPVSCSLEVIDDHSAPPSFSALSYCWGDATDTTEITNHGKTVSVAKNLFAALHRLRQRDQSKLVWADAICINQNDIAERNQQVSIINKIYQNSSQLPFGLGLLTKTLRRY